jgi:hypothetical protein
MTLRTKMFFLDKDAPKGLNGFYMIFDKGSEKPMVGLLLLHLMLPIAKHIKSCVKISALTENFSK